MKLVAVVGVVVGVAPPIVVVMWMKIVSNVIRRVDLAIMIR